MKKIFKSSKSDRKIILFASTAWILFIVSDYILFNRYNSSNIYQKFFDLLMLSLVVDQYLRWNKGE